MEQTEAEPTVPELIDLWDSSLRAVAELGDAATDEQWRLPTPCPGWSVGDVVAHLIDIEQLMSGSPRPQHEPDWANLPHAQGDFGRMTEVGVDVRRSHARQDVIAELRATIALRRSQLEAVPDGAEVIGPFGNPTSMDRLLRIRIFDTWAHQQDIRTSMGLDAGWDTAAAAVSQEQIVRALPYVWARTVGAPEGATVRIEITDPSLPRDVAVEAVADKKGAAAEPRSDATVWLTASWPDVSRLACGRVDPTDPQLRERVVLRGDPALGEALMSALSITP
jgi:uncharacterized protein (TIGR03083 family)